MLPNLLVSTLVNGRLHGLWLKLALGADECGSPQTACCGRTVESAPVAISGQGSPSMLSQAWRNSQEHGLINRAIKSDSRTSNACELRGVVRTSG